MRSAIKSSVVSPERCEKKTDQDARKAACALATPGGRRSTSQGRQESEHEQAARGHRRETAHAHASIAPLTVPIWLTLSSGALQAPASTARATRPTLVLSRSSPTISTPAPAGPPHERRPRRPVVLRERVLDQHDRERGQTSAICAADRTPAPP